MRLADPVLGSAFGLRSPISGDAAFTVALRSDPARSQFLHRIGDDVAAQKRWQVDALARDDDLPLVIFRSTTHAPVGTAGIYNIDPAAGSAEWGRWVISRGSLAAVESALLVVRVAFEHLSLQRLYSRTLARNTPALSFHDSLGLERVAEGHLDVDGAQEVYVEHQVTADQASVVRRRLEPIAERIARRLR